MKKIYSIILVTLFTCTGIFAQNEFITKWDTRLSSPTNSTIQFGALGDGFTLSYAEQGGNGYTGDTTVSSNPVVILPEPGVYIVKMSAGSGDFYGWNNNDNTPAYAYAMDLLEIQQWGNTTWTYLAQAFRNSINMDVTATDVPDMSSIGEYAEGLFWGCPNLKNANGSISDWDLSNMTNISSMFDGDSSFNQPLNKWDVSNVTDMDYMFASATSFNQPLNNWNTSNVKYTFSMFSGATAFNQSLDSWDVSNVIDMSSMFASATSFNQPIGNWNVANVINMSEVFYYATAFNQPINNWDVVNVTSMYGTFADATSFNQPLNNWNTSSVTDMEYMFYYASVFNQNLGGWNLSSLTSVDSMLNRSGLNCTNYDNTLIGWAASSNTPNDLSLGANGLYYDSPAQAAYNTLTDEKGWTITDAGLAAGCAVPLPVKLTGFNATAQKSSVLLNWATATEINNKGFAVQRSANGNTNWATIGFVNTKAASGNSSSRLAYDYTDASPNSGENYYRLIQTDLNGNQALSETVNINFTGVTADLQVYPNPAHGTVTINGLSAGNHVNIYAADGRLVKQFTALSSKQQADISNLPAGVYILKALNGGNTISSITFIIQ